MVLGRRNKIIVFIVLLLVGLLSDVSGQLPSYRQYDWANSGLTTTLPYYDSIVNVVQDLGLDSNGLTDNTNLLNSAIAAATVPTVFVFPTGNYLFNSNSIVLKSYTVLRGEGSENTHLTFDFGGIKRDAIRINGQKNTTPYLLQQDVLLGNTFLPIIQSNNFLTGEYYELYQDNGAWDANVKSWGANSVGQVAKIDSVSLNGIYSSEPMRTDFLDTLNAKLFKITPVLGAGIECLKISRLDNIGTSTSSYSIGIYHAAQCWIKGVESKMASHQHVNVKASTHIEISGCYFNDAHEHSNLGGGQGYGITLAYHTDNCLIYNNIFQKLRHSMMVKQGANGNVFAYNYSFERKAEDCTVVFGVPVCFNTASGKADINLHGHYPYANLFEGNIVECIIADDYYGPNGPHNTFLRNRINNKGIEIANNNYPDPDYPQDSMNIIGNEILNSGQYQLNSGSNHFARGNNSSGSTEPPGTASLLVDSSYVSNQRPLFWNLSGNWPTIGYPLSINTGSNPAKFRVDNNLPLTVCPFTESVQGGAIIYDHSVEKFYFFEGGIWQEK